jgi:hypothetical protein
VRQTAAALDEALEQAAAVGGRGPAWLAGLGVTVVLAGLIAVVLSV